MLLKIATGRWTGGVRRVGAWKTTSCSPRHTANEPAIKGQGSCEACLCIDTLYEQCDFKCLLSWASSSLQKSNEILLPGLSNKPATEQSVSSSSMPGMQVTPKSAEFKLLVDLLPVTAVIRPCALRRVHPMVLTGLLSGNHVQMKLHRIRD